MTLLFFLDKFLNSIVNLVSARLASFRFDIQYVQQQESTKPKHRQNTAEKLTYKIYKTRSHRQTLRS